MTVKSRILELFARQKELSVKKIVDKLGVSKQMAHIALNQLTDEQRMESSAGRRKLQCFLHKAFYPKTEESVFCYL